MTTKSSSSTTLIPNHANAILAALKEQQRHQKYVDLHVSVENNLIGVHKTLLAAVSEYFRKLLDHSTDAFPIITLPIDVVKKEGFDVVLEFIYNGTVTLNVNSVLSVMSAASFLQITSLEQKCYEFCSSLDIPNNTIPLTQNNVSKEENDTEDKSRPKSTDCVKIEEIKQENIFPNKSNDVSRVTGCFWYLKVLIF